MLSEPEKLHLPKFTEATDCETSKTTTASTNAQLTWTEVNHLSSEEVALIRLLNIA